MCYRQFDLALNERSYITLDSDRLALIRRVGTNRVGRRVDNAALGDFQVQEIRVITTKSECSHPEAVTDEDTISRQLSR